MTPTEKLARVQNIVDDTAGWELAANQLQSKLVKLLREPDEPEPAARFSVAQINSAYYVIERHPDGTFTQYARTGEFKERAQAIAWALNQGKRGQVQ